MGFLDSSSYSSGQKIFVTITICSSATEWFGLWPAGTSPGSANSVNWQYTCGGQSCARAQSTGTFRFELSGATVGSQSWPLSGSFQAFYISATSPGIVSGPTLSIGSSSTPIFNPVPAPVTAPAPAPSSCRSAIAVGKTCFTTGEQISATFTTCGSGTEWIGVYSSGSSVSSPALNWQYACVGQSCARAAVAGTYSYGFNAGTTGAASWPLGSGTYQIYFHSSTGTIFSSTFTIATSCTSTGSRRPVFRTLWEN